MADTSRHSVFCEHIGGDGATVLEHACKLGLEGIVSKRADALYRSGTRREWVKVNATALHRPDLPAIACERSFRRPSDASDG